MGEYVQLGEKYHRVTISPDGALVLFAPAATLPTGTIGIPDGVEVLALFGPKGHFFCKPAEGKATVPAGRYKLHSWRMIRKDASGTAWQLEDHRVRKEKAFDVEPDKQANLDSPEPLTWEVGAQFQKQTHEYSIYQQIQSHNGDFLDMTVAGRTRPAPRIRITSADGKYDRTFTMEYG